MKRFFTVLVTTLLLAMTLCVSAGASDFDGVAKDLAAIGMFRGTEKGFELDRAPTRNEAAIMLVRLYGEEDSAKSSYAEGKIAHPFKDVSEFASPYVAWLYTNGITRGTSTTTFSSQAPCTAQSYAVFLLRALGYKEGTDFEYADAAQFAMTKGMFDGSLLGGTFLRDDLAALTYQALGCKLADGSDTLLGSLISSGAISAASAKPITDKLNAYNNLMDKAETDNIDASLNLKANMSANMSTVDGGETLRSQMDAGVTAKVTLQAIAADPANLQLGMKLDMTVNAQMDDPDSDGTMTYSQPVTAEIWIKDNWVYYSDGTDSYKESLDDNSLGELMVMLNSATDLESANAAVMLPYIDSITAKQSGSETVYTVEFNNGAINGLFEDLFDAIFTDLGIGSVTVTTNEVSCSYVVGANGLKSEEMTMEMTVKVVEDETLSNVEIKLDMSASVAVNATGSSVRVKYPDLSKFE